MVEYSVNTGWEIPCHIKLTRRSNLHIWSTVGLGKVNNEFDMRKVDLTDFTDT